MVNILFVSILGLFCASAIQAKTCTSCSQLLPNPSFELYPNSIAPWDGLSGTSHLVPSSQVPGGSIGAQSLFFSSTGTRRSGFPILATNVFVPEGCTPSSYTLSVSLKSNLQTCTVLTTFASTIVSTSVNLTSSSKWTTVEQAVGLLPAGGGELTLAFHCSTTTLGVAGVLYLDNLSLTPVVPTSAAGGAVCPQTSCAQLIDNPSFRFYTNSIAPWDAGPTPVNGSAFFDLVPASGTGGYHFTPLGSLSQTINVPSSCTASYTLSFLVRSTTPVVEIDVYGNIYQTATVNTTVSDWTNVQFPIGALATGFELLLFVGPGQIIQPNNEFDPTPGLVYITSVTLSPA